MITRVEVDGFKSLSNLTLDLKPGLNILVGPNGSGKTNIILFFEFLSFLVRGDVGESISRIGGVSTVFRRTEGADFQKMISATVYGCRPSDSDKFIQYKYSFEILFPKELEYVVFQKQELAIQFIDEFDPIGFVEGTKIPLAFRVVQSFDLKGVPSIKVETDDIRLLRFPFLDAKVKKKSTYVKKTEEFIQGISSAQESFLMVLSRYTEPLRFIVNDLIRGETYNIIPSRVREPEDSTNAPRIQKDGVGLSATLYAIKKNIGRRPQRHFYYMPYRPLEKTVQIKDLLTYVKLANSAIEKIDVVNDPYNNKLKVTVDITDQGRVISLPLSAMSDGTIKWIALITAIMTASSIFSIEEPENYLHPFMQAEIIKIMRDVLFKQRKYTFTIMTTHSETILNNAKPEELIVTSFENGKTAANRCSNSEELMAEIQKTGFGLSYYYLAGAVQND